MAQKNGFLSRLFGSKAPEQVTQEITPQTAMQFGAMPSSMSSMIAFSGKDLKTREQVYSKWAEMESHSIVSLALQLLATSALGGHETTGQLVFIEPTTEASRDKKTQKLVEDIASDIVPLLNKTAFQLAYTSAAFGDAYVRINTREKEGVVDLYVGELLRPQLVQPFERAGKTQGYVVYSGNEFFDKFDALQIGRVKLPRLAYVPQVGDIEKAYLSSLRLDDPNDWSMMPSSAGGSFLVPAEAPYANFTSSLLGLVGQRWLDSIDEQVLLANMNTMTVEQQRKFLSNVKLMMEQSQQVAQTAIAQNRPIMERIRHIIPVFDEKQMLTVAGASSNARTSNIQIDDVLLHAKMLSGALGVDLSMLGFADQLSGGLGDGGFFRVSAQAAERGRILRTALSELFDHIIEVHLIKKGLDSYDPKNKPWVVNFYGNISALESERQRTRLDAMSSGMQLAQTIQQLKDMGANKEIVKVFLSKSMLVDDDLAESYSAIVDAPSPTLGADDAASYGGDDEPV